MIEPVPILTVGDLKSELSRWSDETPVNFYSPLREQEFRFTDTGLAIAHSSLRSMNSRKRRRSRSRRPSGLQLRASRLKHHGKGISLWFVGTNCRI